MPPLTGVDYGIVGIVGLSGVVGLVRGLVREVFSLLAWAAAVWVGLRYGGEVSAHLSTAINPPSVRFAAAFALLLAATLVVAGVLAFLLNKLVQGAGLAGTDRLAGMVFGLARGALLVAVLVLGAGATPLAGDPWWKSSKLIPPFQALAFWLRGQIDRGGPFKSSTASHR